MDAKQIKSIIDQSKSSKEDKYIGRKYYYYEPKKEPGYLDTYSNGKIHTVKTQRPDLYINFFKMIVNQKIDYILSKPISNKVDIQQLPQFNFNDILDKMALSASLDTTAWMHLYINDRGNLDWIQVSDSEIIPLYDKYDKYIAGVIRYYNTDKDTLKAELWTPNSVITYTFKEKKETVIEVKPHFYIEEKYRDNVEDTQEASFGMIPFIPLYNNKAHEGDINDIYSLIDMYNSISTGLIDNIDLFQEALVKLKGFTGDAEELQQAMQSMKISKAVGVPVDGDVDYLKVDIPVEARQMILQLLKSAIYSIGRGVDIDNLANGGTNITNVYIKSKFANLDMKANDTEKQMKIFYYQLIDFINAYYNSGLEYEISFNKSQLFNDSEVIGNNVEAIKLVQAKVLSKTTLMNQIPYIDNVELEKLLIEAENNTDTGVNDPGMV